MSAAVNGNTIHNDRNVYILGAGFSADAGMPLVLGFMNTMRDARCSGEVGQICSALF